MFANAYKSTQKPKEEKCDACDIKFKARNHLNFLCPRCEKEMKAYKSIPKSQRDTRDQHIKLKTKKCFVCKEEYLVKQGRPSWKCDRCTSEFIVIKIENPKMGTDSCMRILKERRGVLRERIGYHQTKVATNSNMLENYYSTLEWVNGKWQTRKTSTSVK